MENQDFAQNPNEEFNDSNEQVQHPQYDEAQQHTGDGKNANQDNTSLASDGPVSKNEGNGTSPDLNDTTKITNADDANKITNTDDPLEPEEASENDTSPSSDKNQEELDLGFDDGDWPQAER